MQPSLKLSQCRKSVAIQVDAELFLAAVRSYPDRFRLQPTVSFEEHFLSLVAASHAAASGPLA